MIELFLIKVKVSFCFTINPYENSFYFTIISIYYTFLLFGSRFRYSSMNYCICLCIFAQNLLRCPGYWSTLHSHLPFSIVIVFLALNSKRLNIQTNALSINNAPKDYPISQPSLIACLFESIHRSIAFQSQDMKKLISFR